MFYAEDKLPAQGSILSTMYSKQCIPWHVSNIAFQILIQKRDLSHLRVGCGVKNLSPFQKRYRSPLVTHRELLIGVCWPLAASRLLPAMPTPKPVQLGRLKCRGSTFAAILWARAERWSPCVRDGKDCAPRDGEKRRDCSYGWSAGKLGGEGDLEEAEVQETFGAFQAEGLSLHQMISELLHKCAFIILFFFMMSRMTADFSLSGEA